MTITTTFFYKFQFWRIVVMSGNVNLLVDGGDFYISHNEDFNFVESLGISMSKIDIRD